MTADFRVAVVVPVRNGARFLPEALQSVLAQDLVPEEIVVVDDGSSDGSGDVARAQGPGIRVLEQPASGAGAARNRGVAATRAPWVAFLDCDDRWMPDKLSRQREAVAGLPGAVAAIGLVRQFFDPSLGRSDTPVPEVLKGTVTSALLIQRPTFEATGGFPTDTTVAEFATWWVRFTAADPLIAVPEVVVAERRIHGNNSGVADPDSRARYVRMVKELLDRRSAPPR